MPISEDTPKHRSEKVHMAVYLKTIAPYKVAFCLLVRSWRAFKLLERAGARQDDVFGYAFAIE